MSDWGLLDQDAALTHAIAAFPNLPIRVVGHSLGGHWLAFHDRIDRVDRVVTVASGPAHWLAHPLSKLPEVLNLWWLAGPAATLALGYLPGRRLGLGADLPAGFFWQWRRWCLRKGYSSSDWGARLPEPDLDKARFNLDLVAIADDWMIPPGVVWRLADFYPKAPCQAHPGRAQSLRT
jgi:predicted alpha/beta hydrolase